MSSHSWAIRIGAVRLWLAAMVLGLLAGCTNIRLVGDYDKAMDDGVTALQKKTESHLVRVSAVPGPKAAPYKGTESFYQDARVEISSLRVRADSTARNSLTVRMLDKLQNNYDRLERMHKEGLTVAEIPVLRGALNSQFTAILTFELAKRRGDSPDEAKSLLPATQPARDDGGRR
ncbi:hypothetical protein JVX96_29980 (plasmid) [Variovorax sp. PDNC026]|uniref:hypothetical protein n=1 Tax=Variovorax sp. PDNC026 TaxID=2811425 RepID=UPI00196340F7|nr:hypothetical protein [Variovorax sp. PDNC026]QRY35531.1 hypothetical protein JVX96_29980 [Variovorax sp. PDNC026]